MSTEIDDGLTDEERAALLEDDGAGTDNNADNGEGADNGETGKGSEDPGADSGAADAGATAAADAAAAADAGATAEATTSEAQPQSAPILVAQVPENVDAQLSEIASKKSSLLDQFDNGDITAREYQTQIDALAKQERSIERQQDRAELASQMEQQRLQNEWTRTCNDFVESNPIYKDNPRLYKALDAEVRELAQKPETATWSGQKFLTEAHKNLRTAFGLQEAQGTEKPADKTQTKQRRELPPNLAKVPSAEIEDTNGGQFAVLDRMANTDPIAYEEALAKMSPAARDAYLAS